MKKRNRVLTIALAAAMTVSLAACGKGDSGQEQGTMATREWAYVPEYLDIAEEEESISYYDMQLTGDSIYYSSYSFDEATGSSSNKLMRYQLADGTRKEMPVSLKETQNLSSYKVMEDGSIFAQVYDWSDPAQDADGYTQNKQFLVKFDSQGKEVYSLDLNELMEDAENSNTYVRTILVDDQGRAYLISDGGAWLVDAEGNGRGRVEINGDGWVNGGGISKDGKVYVAHYNNTGNGNGYCISEIDFDQKKVVGTYENFPNGNGDNLSAGLEKDFIVHDGSSVYEYDVKTQSTEKLFDWLDSDINGSYVRSIAVTEDGRILATMEDYDSGENGIALLTRKKASEVPQKEEIVVATMSSGSDLQAAAVRFNKSSDQYHVSIRQYVDYNNWNENSWNDAITRLNNDITSNNCPDIIDLSSINVEQFVAKGVFEDLAPYLEKSENLKREDLLENVLQGFTYDGLLVGIPSKFSIQTVVGKTSDVGKEMGWSLDDMIAFADAHPGVELFDRLSKSTMMYYCMMYNESAFVDWNTGTCHFDSPEFKSLLEFVNRFPDEIDWEQESTSEPTRIQNGEVLLSTLYINDFERIQMYIDIFGGEITCIGFPTTDGSIGCALNAEECYGIAAKSGKKDGAWDFIESYLTKEDTERWWWGFPTNKKVLEKRIQEAVEVKYLTDQDGNPILDENGEPIVEGGTSSINYDDGWSYTYHQVTQEEVDMVLELMDVAKPASSSNDAIMSIINEEAEAYFKGQKSVDDVAGIIQSRVNVYVSENS